MGSEALGHKFTVKDPTFKGKAAGTKNDDDSNQHSLSHTSGTQPVSLSNGPQSSASPSMITKAMKHKPNSKYRKLVKTHLEQISRIETTLDSIESFSQSCSADQQRQLVAIRNRLNEMKVEIDDFREDPIDEDYENFDRITEELQRITDHLKTIKTTDQPLDAKNPLDLLVAPPLIAPHKHDNSPAQTLIYD